MDIDFDTLIETGLRCSRQGDTPGALAAWRLAVKARPDSALPHFLTGAEFAQARLDDRAESAYAHAVSLAPNLEIARYQLGLLQFILGRSAMAHVIWEPLLHLSAGHPMRSFVLGFVALARDQFDIALAHFDNGMAANRKNGPMNDAIAQVVAVTRSLGKGVKGV